MMNHTEREAVGASEIQPGHSGPSRKQIRLPRASDTSAKNRRSESKVSRACDQCKLKKIRCSGHQPCNPCVKKRIQCSYNSKYSRGRPPVPTSNVLSSQEKGASRGSRESPCFLDSPLTPQRSRVSPEVEMSGLEGQYCDTTSGLSFLHRAWGKFRTQEVGGEPQNVSSVDKYQLMTSAGDHPFFVNSGNMDDFLDRSRATELLAFYFDNCVVTYQIFHRQTVESWLETILSQPSGATVSDGVGNAKASIIFTILAIATFRMEKIRQASSLQDSSLAFQQSDQLFCKAMTLTEAETGFPRLESAQARLIQVLYLLQTSRMNKGWYTFGSAFHVILSLGLHRRQLQKTDVTRRNSLDYITSQCRKRTFWIAYTIDKYLSVVFGRPQMFNDHDIDQDFPDRVNDEDMVPQGPEVPDNSGDCHVDSLIFHAKIAQIIGRISREVYSIKPDSPSKRMLTARRFDHDLHEWHENLPPHLGTVKPSSLVPSFRREATALTLAYAHAIMHANRPFLLGDGTEDHQAVSERVGKCINAAKLALETVDRMAKDDNIFHSFWWTHYVTFCALVIVYVWEITSRTKPTLTEGDASSYKLFNLAEKCRSHLVQATPAASPSRRYGVVLEELRLQAKQKISRCPSNSTRDTDPVQIASQKDVNLLFQSSINNPMTVETPSRSNQLQSDQSIFDEWPDLFGTWTTSDWLNIDASIYFPLVDMEASPTH